MIDERWRCVEAAAHTGEKFQYKTCGLDDIFLLNGYKHVTTSEGEGIAIADIDDLHRAIGKHLATQKKQLSGKELRFLRKQMDLTQAEVGRFIGLGSQQVARWEKDQSCISGPADYLIRKLYLEHINGKLSLRELVEELDDSDSTNEEEQVFKKTDGEWRAVA